MFEEYSGVSSCHFVEKIAGKHCWIARRIIFWRNISHLTKSIVIWLCVKNTYLEDITAATRRYIWIIYYFADINFFITWVFIRCCTNASWFPACFMWQLFYSWFYYLLAFFLWGLFIICLCRCYVQVLCRCFNIWIIWTDLDIKCWGLPEPRSLEDFKTNLFMDWLETCFYLLLFVPRWINNVT